METGRHIYQKKLDAALEEAWQREGGRLCCRELETIVGKTAGECGLKEEAEILGGETHKPALR